MAETAAALRTAADSYEPDRVRPRTISLTRLAALQFAHGDPEEAVAIANAALDAAGTVQSRQLDNDLATQRHSAGRH